MIAAYFRDMRDNPKYKAYPDAILEGIATVQTDEYMKEKFGV